jgi:hypothetical protein
MTTAARGTVLSVDWATVATAAIVAGASIGGTLGGVALTSRRDDRRAAAARRSTQKDGRKALYGEFLAATTVLEHLAADSPPLAEDWKKAVVEYDRCNGNLILAATDPVRETVRALSNAWRNIQWHGDDEVGAPPVMLAVYRAFNEVHAGSIAVAREAVATAMRADVGPDSDSP